MMVRGSRPTSFLSLRSVQIAVVAALFAAISGCNGEGTVTVIAPPEPSVKVSGQVKLPGGDLARASSLWRDMFATLVAPVQALFSPAVEPVGSDVEVQLVDVDPEDAIGGSIPDDLPVLATAGTNDNGQYELRLPAGTTADRCRYLVRVGDADDGTLTRAFVFRSDGPVDIDFASETVVRQILNALADGLADDLCDFESGDIALLYQAVLNLPGTIPGDTIAAVNANSDAAVSADAGFQGLLEDAGLPGQLPATRTPTATVAIALTPTRTATSTRVATATETPRPTRTEAATPTRTPSPSVTSTRPTASPTSTAPTASPTRTASLTATSTVVPPTATPTLVPPTATNSPIIIPPTNTVAVPTATSTMTVATATIVAATHTPTRSPTGTATRTPSSTPTQPPVAALDVGSVSGGAGMIVSVPVVLVGTAIVAVSTDIDFDAAVVDVVLVGGAPDCEAAPTLPANKRVVASLPTIGGLPANRKVLRVGVIGVDNNDPIPAGTLLSCRFEINAGAPLGPTALLSSPDASDASGNAVVIDGSDGSITVTASPPSLDLNMVVGTIGESITITGTLRSRGQTVSAVSTDIAVGTAMLDVVLGDDQVPDCVVADAIGGGTVPDKQVFAALVPDEAAAAAGEAEGVSTEVLRVGVVATNNNQPIPDGQVFHCQLAIPGAATPQSVALTHRPEGSSPDGMTVGLLGTPGQISIVEP